MNLELWQEDFRPSTTKDIVLPVKVRNIVDNIISGEKPLPHFLLYYPKPGNGKTSLAKALCKDLGIQDLLYINASMDGTIDNLRNLITSFVMTRPMGDGVKVVILDEMEKSSPAFQDALKVFLEEYSEFVRFFLITNNVHKIIEPLHSRTSLIDFKFENPEVKAEMVPKILERLQYILKTKGIEVSPEILSKLIEGLYPDIRSMIKVLHLEYIENNSITPDILNRFFVDREFYDLIINLKFKDTQSYLKRNGCNYGEMYGKMFRELIPLLPKENKADVILVLSNYEARHPVAMTPELTFAACTLEIMKCLTKRSRNPATVGGMNAT